MHQKKVYVKKKKYFYIIKTQNRTIMLKYKGFFLFFLTVLLSAITYQSIAQGAQTYYKMGLFKYNIRDFDNALIDFDNVVEISPNFEQVYQNRGLLKYRLEDYHGAIEDFSNAIDFVPSDLTSYFFRAMSKIELLDYAGALADFETILVFSPENTLAYTNVGYVYYLKEEHQLAIDNFDKALSINQEIGEAFFYRGMAKHYLGDEIGRCNDLKKANKLDYAEAFDEFVESFCN